VIDVWPLLPAAVRESILILVKAASAPAAVASEGPRTPATSEPGRGEDPLGEVVAELPTGPGPIVALIEPITPNMRGYVRNPVSPRRR
jgi:hypothetical protein